MNKTQLAESVAQATGMKKKEAETAVTAMTNAIIAALQNGEKVQIVGFGTFEVKERAERSGRNPKTGEVITVAASKHAAFTAGKALKDSLN
ncbi:MAG: HU family DNA-binding protein [Clostridia bacterium]|nr:HU family DNA-binding protein [Clostridia bacterium]